MFKTKEKLIEVKKLNIEALSSAYKKNKVELIQDFSVNFFFYLGSKKGDEFKNFTRKIPNYVLME